MKRNILLIARDLQTAGTELDAKLGKYVPVSRDTHLEIEQEIGLYGRLERQRTSGILPCIQTPAEGIDRDTVLVDPGTHPTTLQARERQKIEHLSFFRGLFPRIDASDAVVIVRDGYSDLRGAIVMYVHMNNKRMLALQRQPQGIELPYDPLYELPNITNVTFERFADAKSAIARFFNHTPLHMAG